MRALDRKLLRDLRRIWAQALAIAAVLACGIMVQVLATGALRSLTETRDSYYERNRFADVFAAATRAPEALLEQIGAIPGVAQAEGRIGFNVVLDLEGHVAPAMGRVVSLPAEGQPGLNLPELRAGRFPDPLDPDEAMISEPFAEANGLRPGDSFRAVLNGRLRELKVTGHALSPEFVYTIGPGSLMPDDRRFGIIWIGAAAAAAAQDLDGAFNDLLLGLTRGADENVVIAAVDTLLAPYGGTGAYGRDRQQSHAFLQNELDQLRAMAVVLPPVFLIVSAFLVNMVLSRLIALERQQIGLLKAIGYSTGAVAAHYLKLSLGVGVLGVAIGWAAGSWLGHAMTEIYADYFRFPWLIYLPGAGVYALSGLLGIATVLVGALRAVAASVRLAPAVAMSPPAPPMFRRGIVDRAGAALGLRQTTMMILRSITRWPGRAAVTAFGVAASVAVLISSLFTFDAVAVMIEEVFHQANRQDITLVLAEAKGVSVLDDARALPGVLQAESAFSIPARFSNGPRTRLGSIEGRSGAGGMNRLLDADGRPVAPPPAGLALSSGLAALLGAEPGDLVTVELLAPPRDVWTVPVATILRQTFGEQAIMPESELFARMRIAPQASQVHLLSDPAARPALYERLKATPAVSGVLLWSEVLEQFEDTISENLLTMTVIYSALGMLITLGVVYNAARIQLSERAHELASLRVLGFSRAEVGYILVGEIMLLSVLAIPFGWLAGHGFAALMAAGFSSELVSIPLVINRSTYAFATCVVLGTALGAALLVRRRLDRVEIASALKQRE